MKPHIKVIQRNGVDVFVTSSMRTKELSLHPSVISSDIVVAAQRRMNNYYAGLSKTISSRNIMRNGSLGFGYYFAGSKEK